MSISTQLLPKRREDLQILRAVAIIGVVYIHNCPEGLCQVWYRPYFNYSVALFLFISGYLTKERQTWLPFYKKRIIRTIVPYIVWTAISVIIYTGDVFRIPRSILTFRASSQMYYIFVYISFVVFTPLIFKIAKSKYLFIGFFVTPMTALFIKYNIGGGNFLIPIYRYLFVSWFIFYYLGILIGNNILQMGKLPSLSLLVVFYLLSLVMQIYEGYYWFSLNDQACGTQLKMSALISSVIIIFIVLHFIRSKGMIFSKLSVLSRFLLSVGNYSFGIFLIHMILLYFLKLSPCYFSIPYFISSIILLLCSWCVCLICDTITKGKFNTVFGFQ